MVDKKIKISILFGIIAAFCWSFADILLVGFVPKVETYSSFIDSLPKDFNSNLAILMLDAPSNRLMWGVYFATFSVFLYLLSVYGIYQISSKNLLSKISVLALFIGYATSPVGHTGFAYIGLLSQSIQASDEVVLTQIKLFEQFEHLLNIHWIVSVFFSALGFLLLQILILAKYTIFNRWIALFNPIITVPFIAFICSLFPTSQIAVMFGCASLNISQLVFFFIIFLGLRDKINMYCTNTKY